MSVKPTLTPDSQSFERSAYIKFATIVATAGFLHSGLYRASEVANKSKVYGSLLRGRVEDSSKICHTLDERIGKLQEMLRMEAERLCRKEH